MSAAEFQRLIFRLTGEKMAHPGRWATGKEGRHPPPCAVALLKVIIRIGSTEELEKFVPELFSK
jgi:hypothetical protein